MLLTAILIPLIFNKINKSNNSNNIGIQDSEKIIKKEVKCK